MGFFTRGDSGENTLVIDIGSGSAGASLVHTHEHGLPEILASARTSFVVANAPSGEALENALISALRNTLGALSSKTGLLKERGFSASVSKALIALSSPWVTTHLKTVIIEREESFKLEESSIEAIIAEEKELFASKLKDSFESESEVFESALTNLYVNGYEAKGPPKDKVKKAEISFLLSAAEKDLLWKIENELIKSFGLKRGVAHQSFMYCYFKVLSHSFQSLHSALLINMTSEMTDVLFLRHGNSALSASLPFGPAHIAREVAAKLGIPQEIADSYLSVFATGSFDKVNTDAIDSVLLSVEDKWSKLWRSMGESIPEGGSVPYSIFLIAPSGYEKLMKTFLESVLPGKHIVVLGETNAFTKELVKAGADIAPDEALYLLSSFSNLLK
jgi:hypothetical protein